MAQIREFTSTNASYFILDGVKYPKSYEAVDDSSLNTDRLKVIPIGRTGEQLLYSTHYRNVRVNGNSFTSLEEAISAINEVVFSKGGGSGGGGTFEGIVTEDTGTVSFTGNGKVGSPLKADSIDTYSTTETKTGGTWIDGKPIYRKSIPLSEFTADSLTTFYRLEIDPYGETIENVIMAKHVCTDASGYIYFSDSIRYAGVSTNDNYLKINNYNDGTIFISIGLATASNLPFIPTQLYLTIEYTKTTD